MCGEKVNALNRNDILNNFRSWTATFLFRLNFILKKIIFLPIGPNGHDERLQGASRLNSHFKLLLKAV